MQKTLKKGFTIVELLIVIVVIGILATIVVVTYNGIQDRAKDQKVQTDVNQIVNKVKIFEAQTSNYPTLEELKKGETTSGDDVSEAKLEEETVKNYQEGAPGADAWKTNKNLIYFEPCKKSGSTENTGAKIHFYDYKKKAATATPKTVGEC